MRKRASVLLGGIVWLGSALWTIPQAASPQAVAPAPQPPAVDYSAVFKQYCVTCHNDRMKTAGLLLDHTDYTNIPANADMWEKVVRKLRAGTMPPQGSRRPDRATYDQPKQLSAGIDKVFVNGVLAYEAGSTSVKRAGRLVGGKNSNLLG